jgi:hypothetical protein
MIVFICTYIIYILYTCIYIYIYMYTYLYMYIYIYIYIHICIFIYIYIQVLDKLRTSALKWHHSGKIENFRSSGFMAYLTPFQFKQQIQKSFELDLNKAEVSFVCIFIYIRIYINTYTYVYT